jgi:hypothetical protein
LETIIAEGRAYLEEEKKLSGVSNIEMAEQPSPEQNDVNLLNNTVATVIADNTGLNIDDVEETSLQFISRLSAGTIAFLAGRVRETLINVGSNINTLRNALGDAVEEVASGGGRFPMASTPEISLIRNLFPERKDRPTAQDIPMDLGDDKKSAVPLTPQALLEEKEIESPPSSGLDEEELTQLSEQEEVAVAITNSSDISFFDSLRTVASMPRGFVMGLRRRIRRNDQGLTEIPMETKVEEIAEGKDLEAQIPPTATLTQYINRIRRSVPPLVERASTRAGDIVGAIGRGAQRMDSPSMPRGDMTGPVGAIAGAVGGGITGGAMGATSALVPAGMAGLVAGGMTQAGLLEYYRRRGIPITDKLRKQAKLIATGVGAGAGLAAGMTGAGQGVVSGAGITETKINVDADVLKSTQAQESQEVGKNKQWQPKIIAPTPAILDKPPQEMYAEDLEASLFDYVVPTSEGANGTIMTNQLKKNQYMNEQFRYYKSGVFIPAKLWEQMNTNQNMTTQKLDKLALGEKPLISLPDMEFMPQNNEETFETVAKFQYPNQENTSIEFLDPYSSYSNVDNYWATNPQSVLYTINP